MSFLDQLETEASYTSTLNGAKTHSTTGDACLDLFAVAGGMRYKAAQEQTRLFDRAYIENPELAMKLLFHIRDIREGLGERELFRTLIRHVAFRWPRSAQKNVAFIAEYGRFDDLMCLMGTPSQEVVVGVIKAHLSADLAALERQTAGDKSAKVSLLAKWMPSINTSSARKRGQARVLAVALGMTEKEYRQTLSKLRAGLCLTERFLTEQKADHINYEAVPAGAMLKYKSAFERKDGERFVEFIEDAAIGKKKVNTGNLYPYEIVRPIFNELFENEGWRWRLRLRGSSFKEQSHTEKALLGLLWDSQRGEVPGENAIAVIDTSRSMFCCRKGTPVPALIAQALGLYVAERCTGTFHNRFITFESIPHLMKVEGETIEDKLCYISTAPWGGSTNLSAVFDLILRTAVEDQTPREEMPSTLYIISDMEFDRAMNDADQTVYEVAKEAFAAVGYDMPAVVFQNVNSWQTQTPVRAHTKGTALSSGAGTATFRHKFDGNITPMEHMLRVLNSERYAKIHA